MADVTIDVAAKTQQARREIKQLAGSFGSIDKAALAAGAAAATALAGIAVASVNATRKLGDELQKLSIRTGETVEDLSRLKLVAELSDVSFQSLGQTSANFSRRLGEAMRSPTSAAATALRTLGLEAEGADGRLLTFKDALFAVADEMAGMDDPTRRAQLAIDVFGRSGAELLPLLDAGSAGIREMMAEADALGITMATQTAEDSARLNDALAKLSGMVGGLGRRIGEFLIPTLADLADTAVRAAKELKDYAVITEDADGNLIFSSKANLRLADSMEEVRAKAEEIRQYKDEVAASGFETTLGQGYDPNQDPYLQGLKEELALLKQRAGLLESGGGTGRPGGDILSKMEQELGLVEPRTDPGLGADGGGRVAASAARATDELAGLRRELETLGLSAEQMLSQRVTGALETLNDGLAAGLIEVEDYSARVSEILAQAREQRGVDHAEVIEQIHEESAAREEAADHRMGLAQTVADTVSSLGSWISSMAIKEGDARTAAQKREAKAGFAVSQAFALGSAAVNTALAITNALATVQPYPAAIAASIQAGIQGAIQIGTIAATSIQGIADAGLMPSELRRAGLNQHTVLAVRNDEAVVDPRGTGALSDMLELERDRMVRDLSRDRQPSGPTVLAIDGRVLGEVTREMRVRDAQRGMDYAREVR